MKLSRHSFPPGRCFFAAAVLLDLHVASAQTFKYAEGATPTEFQGFVTTAPGLSKVSPMLSSGTIPNCYTMTIYQSFPSAAQSWSAIGCAPPGFNASTLYREIVVGATTTTPSPGPSTRPTGTAPSGPSSTPVKTSAAPEPTHDEPANTPQTNPPTSQAWIAGAVIGPVAAIALATFLVFWLRRRKVGRGEMKGGIPRGHVGDQEFESATVQSTSSPPMFKSELGGGGVSTVVELADHRPFELDAYPVVSNGAVGYENGSWGTR
ncbi:hypothetical protein C8A01DRAFT_20359 [Parachaetomium inaequale]|uniref:Uncharacterized protein n=1 Tax=Parachaetomium inaequale TaxID=2588326 RepID=A0AAN6PA38_9PEZI|nr:hypothetical protein C8A01DRAFT_20359 [Parachaetomium inaequale]